MSKPRRGTARTVFAEWRAFVGPGHRRFLGIGVGQGAVAAMASDGLTIPLLLALGTHPALATVIGTLPFAFSSAQLLIPRLLRRFDGNLRAITIAILLVGETRGFTLAIVTWLAWAKILPTPVAIGAIAAVMTIAGAATTVGGANLLAWYGAILPDSERRLVAPRVMGTTLGLGAFLLVPIALLVQATMPVIGIRIYAGVFAAAGIAGVAELLVVRRLPRPGRVRIANRGVDPAVLAPDPWLRDEALTAAGDPAIIAADPAGRTTNAGPTNAGPTPTAGPTPNDGRTSTRRGITARLRRTPAPPSSSASQPSASQPLRSQSPAAKELSRFLRSITIAAFGAGFGPYLSIYAISVLHLSAGFAILLSGLASAAALVSATIVGGMLARGSASRTLRVSFILRGSSMILGLLSFPQNPAAWLVLCAVAIMASAGAAAGTLAGAERLMRLAPGAELIRAQGRYVAGTALGLTAGQLSNASILALLPLGFPAFAILYAVSGVTRFATAIQVEVSSGWSSTTRVYRDDDLTSRGPDPHR